jgi:hypothetical protein
MLAVVIFVCLSVTPRAECGDGLEQTYVSRTVAPEEQMLPAMCALHAMQYMAPTALLPAGTWMKAECRSSRSPGVG